MLGGDWCDPICPNTDSADTGIKEFGDVSDDCMTHNFEVHNAKFMDKMCDEDDAFDEGADVPPVTTVEETVSRKCVRDHFKRIGPRRPVRSCSHPGC